MATEECSFAFGPLPPFDAVLPEHIAYVRSVVSRFSVTPVYWREDLVQEVLIEAHKSRASRLNVRALLFGITRHVVLRWIARREVEQAAVQQQVRRALPSRSMEDDWHEAERREMLWDVLNELPDILREVFICAELQDMSMPEVARDLGIPLNTGYTRLHHARSRFIAALQRHLIRRGNRLPRKPGR